MTDNKRQNYSEEKYFTRKKLFAWKIFHKIHLFCSQKIAEISQNNDKVLSNREASFFENLLMLKRFIF